MSDQTFRHSFVVLLTHVDVVMENIMPIRIRHRDKDTTAVQQADVAWIIIEMRHLLQESYTAIERLLGCYTDPYKHNWASKELAC